MIFNKTNFDLIAKKLRLQTLEIIFRSNSSHIASNFSIAEILAYLFFKQLAKDNLIISKGHAAAIYYAYQALKKKISKNDLLSFNQDNTFLSGHVTKNNITKADFSTGSLGHGLPVSLGFALSNKLEKNKNYVWNTQ